MKRDVWILIAGQFVSVVGDGLAIVAVLWWVLQSTRSPGWVGGVAAISAASGVAASPFAGVIVDRLDRRRLMIAVDLGRAGLYGVLALLAVSGHLALWALVLLLAVARAAGELFSPALVASLPRVAEAENLARANSLVSMSQTGGQIVGAALGGVLVAAAGAGAALGADALSFLCSAASLAIIVIPAISVAAVGPVKGRFWREAAAGVAFLARDGLLRGLGELSLVINGVASALTVLLPLLAQGPLHAGVRGYGFLEAGVSAGTLLGYAGVAAVPAIVDRAASVYLSVLAFGLAIIGLAAADNLEVAILLAFVGGMVVAPTNIVALTLFQRRVPSDMQGRIFSLLGAASQGIVPVTQAVAGVAAQLWRAAAVTAGCGVVISGGAVSFALSGWRSLTVALVDRSGA